MVDMPIFCISISFRNDRQHASAEIDFTRHIHILRGRAAAPTEDGESLPGARRYEPLGPTRPQPGAKYPHCSRLCAPAPDLRHTLSQCTVASQDTRHAQTVRDALLIAPCRVMPYASTVKENILSGG